MVADVGLVGALSAFRQELHASLGRRDDALFELCDAILTAGTVSSLVHLTLAPAHRRGWGSFYAALSKGGLDEGALCELLMRHPLDDDLACRQVFAVDHSVWPRCDAAASPERGYYYHLSRHSAGQPIVAGWAYQLIGELGISRGSWIAPMDARRVKPTENANLVATEQVRGLLRRLPKGNPVLLFVFDAGYDATRLSREFEGYGAQLPVRLNSRR